MHIKFKFLLAIAFLVFVNLITKAQEYKLISPDGKNVITITNNESLSYAVTHNGQLIIAKSNLNITIDEKELATNAKVQSEKRQTVDQVIIPVVKEKYASIKDNYNELKLTFKGRFSVIFRAYDDGVAYRFSTDFKKEITVNDESVNFQFEKDFTAVYPVADGFFTHYERSYKTMALGALPSDQMSCIPLMVQLDNNVKAVITESGLLDYPGFYIKNTKLDNGLNAVFPNYPLSVDVLDDRSVKVKDRASYLAKTKGKRDFPWRILIISEDDKDLIETSLVYQLAEPSRLTDTEWIKPGKVAWDWYNANNIYGVDFKSGVNTETYKYYIDFASQYGLEYIILDEGWYDIKTNDLLHPVKDIAIDELVSYGQQKNVEIILWVTWKALDDQLDQALQQFDDWGAKGIKVDFMQRDDQWMVQYYERVARKAAEHQLLVDYHGSYKPAGLRRTYPNVISREGVSGLENNKWDGQSANPEYSVQLPFLRMLAGPLDYTPGAMINAQKVNYNPVFQRPMSLGTRCHQLGLYTVFESPLQMLADSPSNYLKEPECMEFLSVVPTTWDDTKVLQAKFGDYVAVARRKADAWFIGALTDWDMRDMEIDFSFLDEGDYNIVYYQDGINADRYASDFKQVKDKVNRNTKMQIHLAPGGGWAAWIYK